MVAESFLNSSKVLPKTVDYGFRLTLVKSKKPSLSFEGLGFFSLIKDTSYLLYILEYYIEDPKTNFGFGLAMSRIPLRFSGNPSTLISGGVFAL